MPIVTATPRGHTNGEETTEFLDTVSTTPITYKFQSTQETLKVKNNGFGSIQVTVNGVVTTVLSAQSKDFYGSIESFDIVSTGGVQSFEVVGTNQKNERQEYSNQIGGTKLPIWRAPNQPSRDEILADPTKPANFYALYDALMSVNKSYISKSSLGKDATGTYDIFKYVFAPPSYEKTLIIGSGMHGRNEYFAALVIYRFFYHLCNNYMDYPQLQYLKNRVRIILMPVENPYGIANNQRYNGNNVDINRNFNFNWTNTVDTFKGSVPLSEVETNYIDQVLTQYSDAAGYIDFHNTEANAVYAPWTNPDGVNANKNYNYSVPMTNDTVYSLVNKIISEVTPIPSPKILIEHAEGSLANNHAAYRHGKNGLIPEWIPGGVGDVAYSREDVRHALEFFGNIIIRYSQLSKPAIELATVAQTIYMAGQLLTFATVGTGWEEITPLTFELSPKCDGVLEVYAMITSHNTNVTALTFLSASITQPNNYLCADSSIANQQSITEVYADFGGKRGQLSTMTAMQVLGCSGVRGDNPGRVTVKIFIKADLGSAALRREKIMIRFTPSDSKQSYTRYTEGAGMVMRLDQPNFQPV